MPYRWLPSGLRPRLLLLILFTVGVSTVLLFENAVRERQATLDGAGAEAMLLSHLAAARVAHADKDFAHDPALDLAWLRSVSLHARLPHRTAIVVVDAWGHVLASEPRGARGDSLVGHFAPKGGADWLQEVRGGDGAWRLVAFTPLRSPRPGNRYVGVGIERAAVLAEAQDRFARSIALLIALGVLVSLVTWHGVRVIVLRRIEALLLATARLRRGDLRARSGLAYGRGELSELARAFDEMADAMERHRHIREQVEERLRLSEARKRAVFEASLDAILVIDADGVVVESNPAARTLFGMSGQALAPRATDLFVDAPAMGPRSSGRGAWPAGRFEATARHADHTEFVAEVGVAPIRDAEANGRVVATVRDVTARRQWEQKLEQDSLHDELTGLYNRRGFLESAGQQLRLAERAGQSVVLVSLDLDGLKRINDEFGHAEGDRAIVELAAALHDSFRESDVIARLGGDEFVVLATEAHGRGAERSIERLITQLAAREASLHRGWHLSASVGWQRAEAGPDLQLEPLLAAADARMYEHKRLGGRSRASERSVAQSAGRHAA